MKINKRKMNMKKLFAILAVTTCMLSPQISQAADRGHSSSHDWHGNTSDNGRGNDNRTTYNGRDNRTTYNGNDDRAREASRNNYNHAPVRVYHSRPEVNRVVIINNGQGYYANGLYGDGYYNNGYYNHSYSTGPFYRTSTHYRRGFYAPRTVSWQPVPDYYLSRFPPAGYNERYVYADRDVLLISTATNEILNALVLLSALD